MTPTWIPGEKIIFFPISLLMGVKRCLALRAFSFPFHLNIPLFTQFHLMKPLSKKHTPLALIILDGWGEREEQKNNAIAQAKTPYFDYLRKTFGSSLLDASAHAVGLPEGQMGNSEIGHMTIGSGSILDTDLVRINKAAHNNEFETNPAFQTLFDHVKKHHSTLHIQGLVSPGGIHSHTNHLYAFLHAAKKAGLDRIALHTFTDGRDTPPKSAATYLEQLEDILDDVGIGTIVTAAGRFYAMDRDNHWDRVEKVEKMLFEGLGEKQFSHMRPSQALKMLYKKGVVDEHLEPVVFLDAKNETYPIRENDGIFFFNFRPDRARQLTQSIIKRAENKNICFVTLTEYDAKNKTLVAFPPERPSVTLADLLETNNLTQSHIAETEKYAHVTYFMNGGRELPHKQEKHILIESRRDVRTHDEAPEMKAKEIADKAIKEIQDGTDILIMNFANADMVGHTGNVNAIKIAIETIDHELSRVVKALLEKNGIAFISSDHGNAEQNFDHAIQETHTAHTLNPVPAILTLKGVALKNGTLADITPTLLDILDIQKPPTMTGTSLLIKS